MIQNKPKVRLYLANLANLQEFSRKVYNHEDRYLTLSSMVLGGIVGTAPITIPIIIATLAFNIFSILAVLFISIGIFMIVINHVYQIYLIKKIRNKVDSCLDKFNNFKR